MSWANAAKSIIRLRGHLIWFGAAKGAFEKGRE
jgi:hypothetical protein